jgi:hypothetical protein
LLIHSSQKLATNANETHIQVCETQLLAAAESLFKAYQLVPQGEMGSNQQVDFDMRVQKIIASFVTER